MDAVELVKIIQRIAKSQGKREFPISISFDPKIFVCSVSTWDKEHPAETRQSEFLKMFPDVLLDANGSVDLCPALLVIDCRTYDNMCIHRGEPMSCSECRKKFWKGRLSK